MASETINVLLMTPDADISDLEAALNSFVDLSVTTFSGGLGTVTGADLLLYDVVMISNNN